jgi:DNA-directed RNA polymerase subunit beta
MTKVFNPNEWFRRSFGKNDGVMDPPGLMKLQISSYEEFLQKDVPPARREEKGLQAVFKSVFPIYDFNKTVSLEFVNYSLEEPKYSELECRARGLSYEAPLKVTVRLVFMMLMKKMKIKEQCCFN